VDWDCGIEVDGKGWYVKTGILREKEVYVNTGILREVLAVVEVVVAIDVRKVLGIGIVEVDDVEEGEDDMADVSRDVDALGRIDMGDVRSVEDTRDADTILLGKSQDPPPISPSYLLHFPSSSSVTFLPHTNLTSSPSPKPTRPATSSAPTP